MLGPVFPLYLHELGATPSDVGLVFGSGNIVGAIGVLPLGAVADRYGRRLVIVGSGIASIVGTCELLLLSSWPLAIVGSALYWIGVAGLPAMSAHVAATTPRAQLGRAMGLIYGGFFLGLIFAAPFAGALAAPLGLRAPIVVAALLFTVSMSVGTRLDPGVRDQRTTGGRLPRSFWVLLALTPIAAFAAQLSQPLFPLYLRQIALVPLELVGVFVALLALGSALFSALGGRLADHKGPVVAVATNALVLTIGAALAVLGASSYLMLGAGTLLLGAAVGSNPVLAAMLERILPPSRRALGYSAFELVYQAGFGASGIAAGVLYDADPLLPFLVTAAAALPVAALVGFIVVRVLRAPLQPTP